MANPWDNDEIVTPTQGGGVQIKASDPKLPLEVELLRQRIIDAQKPEKAPAPPSGYRLTADGNLEPIPGGPQDPKTLTAVTKPQLTARERADAIAAYTASQEIDRLIGQIGQRFMDGPGATTGVAGVKDYFPSRGNDQFDKSGNALRGYVGTALGFTGGQLNTATEAEQSVGPYLPKSADFDATVLDKISNLRNLAQRSRERSTAILGGIPDANGQVTPLSAGTALGTKSNETMPPNWGAAGSALGGNGDATLAPGEAFSTPEDLALQKQLEQAYRGNASIEQLNQISTQAGRGSLAPEWIKAVQERDKGRPRGPGVAPRSGQPTAMTDAATRLAGNPIGAGLLNYADFAGFGIPRALGGDAGFDAAAQESPISSTLGGVAGALTGTGLLAGGARRGLGAVEAALPAGAIQSGVSGLRSGGGRLGMFGRQLATDAGYGGIYGGVTEGDPLTGAALASAGSVLGHEVREAKRGIEQAIVGKVDIGR